MKRFGFIAVFCIVVFSVLICGCTKVRQVEATLLADSEASIREVAEVADPQSAMKAIYETLGDRKMIEINSDTLESQFGIAISDVKEFYARATDPKTGLANTVFVIPAEDKRDSVREALHVYKERMVEEYKNYDILDSLNIAQSAVVYDQGDYVVMLMLPNMDAAKEIVDRYIPQ